MERFTATSYESAMKLAKTKLKNGFEEMLHLVASFAPIKPNYLFFTKFDETIRPGKLLTVLNETGLKVCGLTTFKNGEIKFSTKCKSHFVKAISKHLGIN